MILMYRMPTRRLKRRALLPSREESPQDHLTILMYRVEMGFILEAQQVRCLCELKRKLTVICYVLHTDRSSLC